MSEIVGRTQNTGLYAVAQLGDRRSGHKKPVLSGANLRRLTGLVPRPTVTKSSSVGSAGRPPSLPRSAIDSVPGSKLFRKLWLPPRLALALTDSVMTRPVP